MTSPQIHGHARPQSPDPIWNQSLSKLNQTVCLLAAKFGEQGPHTKRRGYCETVWHRREFGVAQGHGKLQMLGVFRDYLQHCVLDCSRQSHKNTVL